MIDVTLYSKEDCCLCEDVKRLLAELGQTYPLRVKEVNIYSDDSLIEQYGMSIPVLLSKEKEIASGIIHKDVIIKFILSAFRG